jgi:UDP-N-acetylmuramoyl-tripeptide--D-alanyl-D-alanine ligase
VERDVPAKGELLRVVDALAALQRIASWARDGWPGDVVGITGSAGKTTTKDVIASLLEPHIPTAKTIGNFNNHVGVPLSILRMSPDAKVAVLELGMNHAGEIRSLAAVAKPRIGVVTNVGYAHVENFASIEGVAAAKRELVESLPPDGIAVLNADDPLVRRFEDGFAGKVVTFGLSDSAAVRAEDVCYGAEGVRFRVGGIPFESALTGRHGVRNILAGVAVAGEYGIAPERLRDAVRNLEPGAMRGRRSVHRGVVIWNDCYNSNPDAARAMLDVLRDTPGARRIAVLGDMRELGAFSERLHGEVGRYAARVGVDRLVAVRGDARFLRDGAVEAGMAEEAVTFFETPEEAGEFVRGVAREGDVTLWKGSRGTRMELALERFTAE